MEQSGWESEESLEALIDDMLLLSEQGAIDSFLTSRLATNGSARGRHEEDI